MPYMQKILEGVIVDKMLEELASNPSVWNRYTLRTKTYESSPHREVDDIFLRYRDWAEFDHEHPERFADQHVSQWYAAADELPSVKTTIEKIFTVVGGSELGGCLITRIPPGKQVYPHSDSGCWHSQYYRSKYLLLLQSAPGQSFEFGDEEKHEGKAGELFIFDNHPVHSVINNSDCDRVSLIMAIRQPVHDALENDDKESSCSNNSTPLDL